MSTVQLLEFQQQGKKTAEITQIQILVLKKLPNFKSLKCAKKITCHIFIFFTLNKSKMELVLKENIEIT